MIGAYTDKRLYLVRVCADCGETWATRISEFAHDRMFGEPPACPTCGARRTESEETMGYGRVRELFS